MRERGEYASASVHDMLKLPDGWQRSRELWQEYRESERFKELMKQREQWVNEFFERHPNINRKGTFVQDTTIEDLYTDAIRKITLIEVIEESVGNFDLPHLWQKGKTIMSQQIGKSLDSLIEDFKTDRFAEVNEQLQNAVGYFDMAVFSARHNVHEGNFPYYIIRDEAFHLSSDCRWLDRIVAEANK